MLKIRVWMLSLLTFVVAGSLVSRSELHAESDITTRYLVASSDLMGAFVAAYEAYARDMKQDGKGTLTPVELVTRNRAVACRRTKDGIEIYFFPPTTTMRGGGIAYLVDPKTMHVIRRTVDS